MSTAHGGRGSGEARALRRLRIRLTVWYVSVFGCILLLLGAASFLVVRRQIILRLDESLERAAEDVMRAARIREREREYAGARIVDALEELHIPDRSLYLFETSGTPVYPEQAEPWVRAVALAAARDSIVLDRYRETDGRTWSIYARRFDLEPGRPFVAVAAADVIEIQEQYPGILAAFAVAALGALVLVAIGGAVLVRKSTDPVEEAFERMRRFMADAAHELRTPATVLRSRAEVALQKPRSAEQYTETLRGMANEAERLGEILDQLLLLASSDAGEADVRRDSIMLDDIVLDAATAAGSLGSSRSVGVIIGTLDEAAIMGDPALIRRLLMIVFDNAVKFTPPGGRVDVAVNALDGRVKITIRDTGIGMDDSVLPHVFERFYRADPARTPSGGAGLGLSIARLIAETHDASIRIRSEPGRGTEVTIVFPLHATA